MDNQEQQSTELEVVIAPELTKVISENQLIELPKATQHALAFAPNMNKVVELSKALATMNKENPTDTEAKVARAERLALVKNRTAAGKIKDERKSGLLTEGKLVDNLYGVVKNSSELIEAEYEKIEKFAENREKERKEKLKAERLELLLPYTENADKFDLGGMEEETFNDLYAGLKATFEAKQAAEQKAIEEKAEAERVEKLMVERSALVRDYNQFLTIEQISKLGEISHSEFNQLQYSLNEAKQKHDEEIEAKIKEGEKLKEQVAIKEKRTAELLPFVVYIRDFNALLLLEEEEYQLQFTDIKKGAELELKSENERVNKIEIREKEALKFLLDNGFKESTGGVTSIEFKHFISKSHYDLLGSEEELTQFKERIQLENIRDKKAKDQEIENARLAKELQDKKDSDAKAEADKILEQKAKAKAEKELLKAGDKVRINTWIDKITLPEIDTKGMTDESVAKVKDIIDKVEKMKVWAKSEAEKI